MTLVHSVLSVQQQFWEKYLIAGCTRAYDFEKAVANRSLIGDKAWGIGDSWQRAGVRVKMSATGGRGDQWIDLASLFETKWVQCVWMCHQIRRQGQQQYSWCSLTMT